MTEDGREYVEVLARLGGLSFARRLPSTPDLQRALIVADLSLPFAANQLTSVRLKRIAGAYPEHPDRLYISEPDPGDRALSLRNTSYHR
ncbi:hypothetical protein [Pseudomonas mohnii]